MEPKAARTRIPVLGSLRRIGRLTWVELLKLLSHKLFPVTAILTLVVTAGLGIMARVVTENPDSRVRFSNYTLWVTTSGLGVWVGSMLLVVVAAMAMSNEATARTLNTLLTRPLRRIEFVLAKILALIAATVAVVAAAALAAFIVGGTVQDPPRRPYEEWDRHATIPEPPPSRFPSYDDIRDPAFGTVIVPKGEVMGQILFGFLLLVVPVLAGVSVGFMLGTLIDSAGLAIGLAIGIHVSLDVTRFVPMLQDLIGGFSYNYPTTRISTLMYQAGQGADVAWGGVLGGVGIAAIYVVVCFAASIVVFCRRDITL